MFKVFKGQKNFPVFALCAVFILVVAIHLATLHLPAFNLDELMWMGVALDEPDAPFTGRKLGESYFYLMNYIGALKGYIYAFVFTYFDPSFMSIRLPLILSAMLATLLLKFPKTVTISQDKAWFGVFFLLICPTVTYFAHLDHGPTTLEYIARCLLLFLTMRVIVSERISLLNAVLMVILIVLAFWNKASFIAFSIGLGAFFIAYALIYAQSAKRWLTGLLGLFIIVLSMTMYIVLQSKFDIGSVSETGFYPERIMGIMGNFSGYHYLSYIGGIKNSAVIKTALFVTLIVSLIGAAVVIRFFFEWIRAFFALFSKSPAAHEKNALRDKTGSLVLLFFITSASAIGFTLVTALALQPWHYNLTFPSLPLLIVICLLSLTRKYSDTSSAKDTTGESAVSAKAGVMAAVSTLCLMSLMATAFSGRLYYAAVWPAADENPTRGFGRLINAVAPTEFFEDTRHFEGDIFLGDWGLHMQVLAYGARKDRNGPSIWEYRFDLEQYNAHNFLRIENTLKSGILVFHGEKATAFPAVKEKVFNHIHENNLKAELCKSYADPDGTVIIEVWTGHCGKFLTAAAK